MPNILGSALNFRETNLTILKAWIIISDVVETESQGHPSWFLALSGAIFLKLREKQSLSTPSAQASPRVLCLCVDVSENEVRNVIEEHRLKTVHGVATICGAGAGCTACHRHIKRLLNENSAPGVFEACESEHLSRSFHNC